MTDLIPATAAPLFDPDGCFVGHTKRMCGEHRTVGEHRAWCFECGEWCYPHHPCLRCDPAIVNEMVRTGHA